MNFKVETSEPRAHELNQIDWRNSFGLKRKPDALDSDNERNPFPQLMLSRNGFPRIIIYTV